MLASFVSSHYFWFPVAVFVPLIFVAVHIVYFVLDELMDYSELTKKFGVFLVSVYVICTMRFVYQILIELAYSQFL